jgi:hypothetical protein
LDFIKGKGRVHHSKESALDSANDGKTAESVLKKPALDPAMFRIVGGGVQLGPFGNAATNRPIVPTPGDYDDGEFGGMMIGRGN